MKSIARAADSGYKTKKNTYPSKTTMKSVIIIPIIPSRSGICLIVSFVELWSALNN